MSDTKKNWLDKTGVIHLWNTIKALLDTKVDKIEGLGLSSNDYTVEDKTKVSKIKPVQNTLTSTDTEAGLSAAQGKVLKDIVDTKADNINVQPITIPTTGWGTENGVSAYPNYIDIPLAGVSSKDAVVIDISPSSAYFAAQAQFTNTESMNGAVRIRAKNVPTAAIKGQWYVIHGGGTVYEGDLHNYYDKSKVDELLAGKLGLHDTADNSQKLDGYELRLSDHPGSANILVQTVDEDGRTCIDCRNDASIGLTAIVASGVGYVRFGDGTQICWGETGQITVKANSTVTTTITYPVAFVSGHSPELSLTIAGNSKNDNYSKLVLHTTSRLTTSCDIYFKNSSSDQMSPIAQWLAIGRWK